MKEAKPVKEMVLIPKEEYLMLKGVSKLPTSEGSLTESSNRFSDIVTRCSPRCRNAVKAIVQTIERYPDIFSTDGKGNLSIEGVSIPGANYDDLIHRAVNSNVKRMPRGYNEFIEALGKTSLGTHWIRDARGKDLVTSVRQPTRKTGTRSSSHPRSKIKAKRESSWITL